MKNKIEKHFPKDIQGAIRDFLYWERHKKNYKHDKVITEIEWLRNIYFTKIIRPNDPLVSDMKPPLPQKIHDHFLRQICVQYLTNPNMP